MRMQHINRHSSWKWPARQRAVRRFSFRRRLALWFGLVMLLSTCLAIALSYRVAEQVAISQFSEKLMAMASSGALGIDGDAFQTLQHPRQMESATYRQIQAHLRRLREANSFFRVRYVYTMAPTTTPGVWRHVVDSEEKKSLSFSRLGATESFPPSDTIWDTLRTGQPSTDPGVTYYPDWGWLLSVAAPIRNSAGRVVGVVAVDAPADAVAAIKSGLQRTAALCLLIGLLFATLVTSLLAWQMTRPLNALIEGTRAVAQGDFTHRVEVLQRDELGEVADSFNHMTEGLRQRDLYKQQFERYVSRQIADKILAAPEIAFWQCERRRATILFADIRSFTEMSEGLPPEDVMQRLNEYLAVMIDIVFEYNGTLDKFLGDGLMAVFGAPLSLGNDEERAVRAALAMQAAVERMCRRWEAEGKTAFRIRIGINTGEVVVGNVGSERRMEYTAIGDPVNLAARLEMLNKEYRTDILMSESTYEQVADLVESRWVAHLAVRGREQPVNVYQVLGMRQAAAPTS